LTVSSFGGRVFDWFKEESTNALKAIENALRGSKRKAKPIVK